MLIARLAIGMSLVAQALPIATDSWEAIHVEVGPPPPPGTGTLNGRVYDKETGLPLEGVLVGFRTWEVRTDTNGYYELLDVPVGSHEFAFLGAGYQLATRQATIAADSVTTLDVDLTPGDGPEPDRAFPWWLVGIIGAGVVAIATKKSLDKR